MAFAKKKDPALAFPPATGVAKRKLILDDPSLATFGVLRATIEGTTSLLMQDASRAADDILEGMLGNPKGPKPPRNLEQEFLDALVCIGPRPKTIAEAQSGKMRYAVPAIWIKQLLVRTGYRCGYDMTMMRSSVFVHGTSGDLIEIQHKRGEPLLRRCDVVTNRGGGADVRIRAEFAWWRIDIEIVFNARALSFAQVGAMLQNGGVTNGLGQLRPFGKSSTGTHGCYRVISGSGQEPTFRANGKDPT